MELVNHEVRFDIYCEKCKHKDVSENDDPCNDCLTEPFNINSRKPVNYEEAEKK